MCFRACFPGRRRSAVPSCAISTSSPRATRGIPIEILGTLELRQLLTALAHHYDRVILDGPAVLGMADCRMLGRMVDASVLVVRAGAHQLVTLQRAKAMLEQSHVVIVGVVVNSLSEDVRNWSSYDYEGTHAGIAAQRERLARPRGAGRECVVRSGGSVWVESNSQQVVMF